MTYMKRTLIVLLGLLSLLVGVPGIAQAAPGTIFTHHSCSSNSSITVQFRNIYTGVVYNVTQPPCTNYGEGPYSTAHSTSEPMAFHTGPGWCTRWEVNDSGTLNYAVGGYSGRWTNIYPGSSWSGWWKVALLSYDC